MFKLKHFKFACKLDISVSNYVQPYGLLPTRLLCPWDSLGKNTGVVAMPSSRGSSRPTDQTQVSHISCIGWRVLYH